MRDSVRNTGTEELPAFLFEQEPRGTLPEWYVVCTVARHEKQVATQLCARGIDHFLPKYEEVHRWKDRRMTVSLPLFPGYVFVRIPMLERLRVQVIPGVRRFVGFGGLPVALPDAEMSRLVQGLEALKAEPHPFLKVGQRVRMRVGPLAGSEGILERYRDKFRIVLSMNLIQQSVAVEVDFCDVEMF
jgi:transcription antitermination factor NusG